MDQNFKLIFLVRFFGYIILLSGILGFIFLFGPLIQYEARYKIDRISGVERKVPKIITPNNQQTGTFAGFSDVPINENIILPVSTQYGIVIEKINANAKIISEVDAGNEREYVRALKQGVAAAKGSTPPGEKGNLYLFSHSTDGPLNIVRYNAVFYLLNKLEKGDRVIIFYQDKRYDYIVFDKTIAQPQDVFFLTNRYNTPVLTMQTCDPPGTLFRRLIVRAKLAGVE